MRPLPKAEVFTTAASGLYRARCNYGSHDTQQSGGSGDERVEPSLRLYFAWQNYLSLRFQVVRAFVQMRERLAANAETLKRLAEIERTLLQHDQALSVIWQHLQPLLAPPPDPPKRKIGFDYKGEEE